MNIYSDTAEFINILEENELKHCTTGYNSNNLEFINK